MLTSNVSRELIRSSTTCGVIIVFVVAFTSILAEHQVLETSLGKDIGLANFDIILVRILYIGAI